jgi:hypothetical protein
MTTEKRTTISLGDVLAIEFECHTCHSKVIRPITLDNAVPPRCSRGCQVQWFTDSSTDYQNLKHLLELISFCSKINSKDFTFRFEVKNPIE